ncbi:CLUMA_CG016734, isoform A [Clunio marinus]|uniref:CLUMA_CG016734, isoform A n=1 Tax=Clunio marinus TaxID=568069 RepID=A0A1J1ITZ0_9DIPT|nr:CLUMA_CG016734, isoform A [Clunio marinus]
MPFFVSKPLNISYDNEVLQTALAILGETCDEIQPEDELKQYCQEELSNIEEVTKSRMLAIINQ